MENSYAENIQPDIRRGSGTVYSLICSLRRFKRKGPEGLKGLTLSPKSVRVWVFILHSCTVLLHDPDIMCEKNKTEYETFHKEEIPARIKSDYVDREKLRRQLKQYFHSILRITQKS